MQSKVKELQYCGISMILLDIEGTTTPIDFVYKNLFGYARDHMEGFLKNHAEDPWVKGIVARLKELHGVLSASGSDLPEWPKEVRALDIGSAGTFCLWLMAGDSKNGALKELQGLIWEEGYNRGILRGEVYRDVLPAMKRWTSAGLEVCIYSSGSVLGQKLLFSTTNYGDLTKYVSEFFDTTVGAKTEAESYRRIASSRKIAQSRILFLSDRESELDAAGDAGLRTAMVARNPDSGSERGIHPVIHSFDDLKF